MPNFEHMTPEEFIAWQQEQAHMAGERFETPASPPAPVQEHRRPAAEVWGSTEYDFECPSGAVCRMRKLTPETLVEHGILDKIATLPGYSAEVVERAEGAMPKPQDAMPSKEEVSTIVSVLEILVPLAVVEPRVFPKPAADEERVQGRIYTDSIELMDRIAIMERAVQGVKRYENFRPGSQQSV